MFTLPVRRALLAFALVTLTALARATAADVIGRDLAAALAPLESLSRTGRLIDRVVPVARIERFDGTPTSPPIDARTWRQALDELRRAEFGGVTKLPDAATLEASVRRTHAEAAIPLGLFDLGYERMLPNALEDGSLRVVDGKLHAANDASPLFGARAFAFAALSLRTYRGREVTFSLDRDRVFADSRLDHLEIDFADGLGFRSVSPGERVRARYAATGTHVLTARVTDGGSTLVARASFEVVALGTPTPDDTLHVTATIPHQGQLGSGEAYVYLAPGRTALANPVVVIEGFDFNNTQNWDELYIQLNQQFLIEELRADGFDAVVLNFTDSTEPIQKNAFVVAELLQQIQSAIPSEATIALVGASMGGLCSRYALAHMETYALPHRVRTWISFDSPHRGANIPLGLQHWIDFFSGQSTDAAAFRAVLLRPAARQMLLYHFNSLGGQADPEHAALAADFASLGNYPTQPRLVAVTNGSGIGAHQGFGPGAQLIRWEYSSFLVSITGNVWAVPDQTSQTVFRGNTRIIVPIANRTVSVNNTRPWDGGPGGARATMDELGAVPAPYGDIVALQSSHAFIPTVSALDLPTLDPFFDVGGTPGLLGLTPFDAVYWPAANQEHVLLVAENAAWVKSEIEAGVTAVSPLAVGPGALRLAAGPNPSRGGVTFDFAVPAGERADLRVYDLAGREVIRLAGGESGAGGSAAPARTATRWDGRDLRGNHAPAGVYLARLTAGGNSISRRFVVVR